MLNHNQYGYELDALRRAALTREAENARLAQSQAQPNVFQNLLRRVMQLNTHPTLPETAPTADKPIESLSRTETMPRLTQV